MTIYIYKGDGAGIPGLPHRVTDEDRKSFAPEAEKQFQSALEAGVYVAESSGGVYAESNVSKPRKTKAVTQPEGD